MSDYVPPENPYDTPQEEGAPAARRSPWVIVLVVVAVLLLAGGTCLCGLLGLSWVSYRRASVAPPPAELQAIPADKTLEAVPPSPDTDET